MILVWSRKQSQRDHAHRGAVGRRKSQWTIDFSQNSVTYTVYNFHVTCSNSSFSLTRVMPTSHFFASIGYVVCFQLATCPSPVLWAYASATITEFNHAQRSGDFPISSTGCTCFQYNKCRHGDISAINLLRRYNPVNILWYTAPVDMMTFRDHTGFINLSVNNIHRIHTRRSR